MLADLTVKSAPESQPARLPPAVDLRQACDEAARSLAGEAARREVVLTLAFSRRLRASVDADALASTVRRLLAAAIEDNEGRALLFTGSLDGGRVRLSILGDGPAPSPSALGAAAREAAATVAQQGGALEDGTDRPNASVVLRLPPAAPGGGAAPQRGRADG